MHIDVDMYTYRAYIVHTCMHVTYIQTFIDSLDVCEAFMYKCIYIYLLYMYTCILKLYRNA